MCFVRRGVVRRLRLYPAPVHFVIPRGISRLPWVIGVINGSSVCGCAVLRLIPFRLGFSAAPCVLGALPRTRGWMGASADITRLCVGRSARVRAVSGLTPLCARLRVRATEHQLPAGTCLPCCRTCDMSRVCRTGDSGCLTRRGGRSRCLPQGPIGLRLDRTHELKLRGGILRWLAPILRIGQRART